MKIKHLFGAAALLVASATSSMAATYHIVGGFSGGQLGVVAFDLTITADFAGPWTNLTTSDGLTINSMTSSVVAGDPFPLTGPASGPLTYWYFKPGDALWISGGSYSSDFRATDFQFQISDFLKPGTQTATGFDTLASVNGLSRITNVTVSVTEIPDEQPSIVPLPAGGLLFLSGLVGLAALRGRKNCNAQI